MQLLNNFQANVNLSRNKKIGIAIGSFIIITIIVLFVSFLGKDSQNKTDVYYDPASKETIDEQADKTPEILEDNVSTEPVFLGFGKLIEYGLSQDQLTNLKNAFNTYLGEGNNGKREVSIYIDSISSYKVNDVADSDFGLSFDVIIDRKTNLSAIMYQLKVSDIQLKLYKEGSDKAVFDSGIVTSSSDPNTEDLVD
jgi:hypothetical protein